MRKYVLAAAVSVCAAVAQPSPRAAWVPLDNSKPGTPADVRLNRDKSGLSQTVVEVVIHGFWLDPKQGPDGNYARVSIPGLGRVDSYGAPDLPVARFDIAVLNGAKEVRLADSGASDRRTFTAINAWPRVYPERDHPGSPERFLKDEKIYASDTPYPASNGGGVHATRAKLGPIPGVTAEVFPVKWNAAAKTLTVARASQFVFTHEGSRQERIEITQDRDRVAAVRFINWPAIADGILVNKIFFRADFLFLYPTGYKNELQALIDQKKARGFNTYEITISSTGNTCASVRTLIQNWYNARFPWSDKYAILVGDTSVIPLCTAPIGSYPTDDLYASPVGDDLDEEIYLGRLSVNSEADLTDQVAKILRYEDHPALFCCYDRALLVAHKEGAPGKYVGAHESVRTAAYAVPPTFSTLYGNAAGVTNASVSTAINDGLGLVAYRGHGSDTEWWSWNTLNQSYTNFEVGALNNLASQVPVLWSFACDNNMLGTSDSIGETWMMNANHRAVAHYGSTVPSYTDANHELDRQMFNAVYNTGLTTHAQAIEVAEANMAAAEGADNAWMYLLLGDPQMQIRRRNPLNINIRVRDLAICKDCFLEVSVFDAVGNPLPNALVAAYKGEGERVEVFANRYTDEKGYVKLPASPASAGTIVVTAADRAGNGAIASVAVR